MLRDLFSLFPAYAGVILHFLVLLLRLLPFPRIRGGDPLASDSSSAPRCFSPHTRG